MCEGNWFLKVYTEEGEEEEEEEEEVGGCLECYEYGIYGHPHARGVYM